MPSLLSNIFTDLRSKIFTDIPTVKTVRIYNNQFDNMDKESAFDFPCVFIDFPQLSYQELGQGVQGVDLVIRLYIGFENLALSQGGVINPDSSLSNEEIGFFELRDSLFKALTNFRPAQCSPMMRSEERTDTNHDNVYVYQMDFITAGVDSSSDEQDKLIDSISPLPLELNVDLIIDNVEIRTGQL